MAIVSCPPFLYGPPPNLSWGTSLGSASVVTLDSDTEYLFFLFVAPRTETIDRFEFYPTTVTSGGNVEVQIYTVTAADKSPNVSVGTEIAVNVVGATMQEVTGLNASVTAGTEYGVRVMVAAGVNIGIQYSHSSGTTSGTIHIAYNTTGSVARSGAATGGIPVGLGTSSGYLTGYNMLWCGARSARTNGTINSSGTDFIGNKITFPFAGSICGLSFEKTSGSTMYDMSLLLCNGAGSVLASRTLDDATDATSGNIPIQMHFTSSYEFATNEVMYLLVRADSANNTAIYYDEWRSADSLAGVWPGCCRVSGTVLGTYSEDTNAIALVYPILNGFSDDQGTAASTFINSRATSHLRR
jgi:hypothetical protein